MRSIHGKSLLSRLIVVQVVCGIAVLLISVVIHVFQATQTEEGELDKDMLLYSRAVAAVYDEPGDTERVSEIDMREVEEIVTEAVDIKGRDLALQVFKEGGGLVYKSQHAPPYDLGSTQTGFGRANIDGEQWRFVTTPRPEGNVVIVVGERISERWLFAAQLAWQVTKPLVWLIPIVLIGGFAASRYAVRPLHHAVASIASRSPEDLVPIAPSAEVSEINPLMRELNRLLLRVEQARKLERDFFADAAHELKTPLAVISAQAYLLTTAPTTGDRSSAAQDLDRALQRASHMVSQLLTLAAVESRVHPAAGRPVDLSLLLAERLAILTNQADEAEVEVSLNTPSGVYVQASTPDLTSIIDNLVDNAIRYNKPGGRVEVSLVQASPKIAVLTVQDDGLGIPAHQREKVFERFYRGDSVRQAGSGLGLPIVRSAVNRLGGKIFINDISPAFSPSGQGVAISIRFPVNRTLATAAVGLIAAT